MKHTSGFWEQSKNYSTIIVSNTKKGQYLICEAHWSVRLTKEEQEANARLIASAPELLEACKLALNELTGGRNIALSEPCLTIQRAIAKAEGNNVK